MQIRRTAVAFTSAAALSLSGVVLSTPAQAQVAVQDGLVNVAVGDIEILNDARIGVAAQVAATICGVKVGPVAVLGTAVDAGGATETVCTIDRSPVTIEQN